MWWWCRDNHDNTMDMSLASCLLFVLFPAPFQRPFSSPSSFPISRVLPSNSYLSSLRSLFFPSCTSFLLLSLLSSVWAPFGYTEDHRREHLFFSGLLIWATQNMKVGVGCTTTKTPSWRDVWYVGVFCLFLEIESFTISSHWCTRCTLSRPSPLFLARTAPPPLSLSIYLYLYISLFSLQFTHNTPHFQPTSLQPTLLCNLPFFC